MAAIMIITIAVVFLTAPSVEGACNVFTASLIEVDFCDYNQLISDLVPGRISANQLQRCVADRSQDTCQPVSDCSNSESLFADALALLRDILGGGKCLDPCDERPCIHGTCTRLSPYDYACMCDPGYVGVNCDVVERIGSGAECYTSEHGWDYRGQANVTVSGFPCQYWANTHPQRVSDFAHFLFHDEANYCRNWASSGRSGPWCYTAVDGKEWDYCQDIPEVYQACNDKPEIPDIESLEVEFAAIGEYDRAECYSNEIGLDYTGYANVTVDGYGCQRWDANYPHQRNDARKSKPRHNRILYGSHNYCRNNGAGPDGPTDGPWCWISDTTTEQRWGYCDTAKYRQSDCEGKGTPTEQLRMGQYPECFLTPHGTEYRGNVDVTESGKTCMAWAELDNEYGVAFAGDGNKCRALDERDRFRRPWCFVSPTESEKCRVKDHYDMCF